VNNQGDFNSNLRHSIANKITSCHALGTARFGGPTGGSGCFAHAWRTASLAGQSPRGVSFDLTERLVGLRRKRRFESVEVTKPRIFLYNHDVAIASRNSDTPIPARWTWPVRAATGANSQSTKARGVRLRPSSKFRGHPHQARATLQFRIARTLTSMACRKTTRNASFLPERRIR
jgi:hypothetical protein